MHAIGRPKASKVCGNQRREAALGHALDRRNQRHNVPTYLGICPVQPMAPSLHLGASEGVSLLLGQESLMPFAIKMKQY